MCYSENCWTRAVTKKNDKHISIDQIINIDFMKESGELHEVKRVSL